MDVSFSSNLLLGAGITLTTLNLDDIAEWQKALQMFENHSLIHRPEYLAACEAGGLGRAEAWLLERNDHKLLLPVIREPFLLGKQDVVGFGGVLTVNADQQFLTDAWSLLDGVWSNEQIQSISLYLDPFHDTSSYGEGWHIHDDGPIHALDTECLYGPNFSDALIVEDMPPLGESIDLFFDLASRSYQIARSPLMNDDYLNSLIWELGDEVRIFSIRRKHKADAEQAVLVLKDGCKAYVVFAIPENRDTLTELFIKHLAETLSTEGVTVLFSGSAPPLLGDMGAVVIPPHTTLRKRTAIWTTHIAPLVSTDTLKIA